MLETTEGNASPAGSQTSLRQIPGRAAAWFRGLRGWRRAMTAAAAGLLSALALPPAHLSPVLFLTLPVLFWLTCPGAPLAVSRSGAPDEGSATSLQRPTTAPVVRTQPEQPRAILAAALTGWWFGFGYHIAGLYWIGNAFLVEAERFAAFMPFAVTAMPAGLAVFLALATGAAALVRGPTVSRVIAFAIAITISEWLRGTVFTGFPWNTIGYAATYPLVMMQAASAVGLYGLTLGAALAATLPLTLAALPGLKLRSIESAALAGLVLLPLGLALAYGSERLARKPLPDVADVRLRLVQPNIAQADKFLMEKRLAIFEQHLDLSIKAPDPARTTPLQRADAGAITHIVWPEAAMPFLALRSQEALDRIAAALPDEVTLIAGTLRLEGDLATTPEEARKVFNSAIAVDGRAHLLSVYDKIHLVPFGEYLPFKFLLNAIGFEHLTRQRGGFTPGATPRTLMQIPGLPPTSMLICYEVIFPGKVRPRGQRPQLLINLTNDAWFGLTSGPYQHFHQARIRAVEQGLPMIRVANNGISGVIDPYGRILDSLPLGSRGAIDTPLPAAIQMPLFARHGDVFFILYLVLAAAVSAVAQAVFMRRSRQTTM